MRRIDYWHVKFPYLGSRKITVKLREDGYKVGRKRSGDGIPAILNSDQGRQFPSAEYKPLLKSLQIRQTLNRKNRIKH